MATSDCTETRRNPDRMRHTGLTPDDLYDQCRRTAGHDGLHRDPSTGSEWATVDQTDPFYGLAA